MYDTITHAAPPLRYLVEQVGAPRVLMGSDYCFPLGDDTPVRTVRALRLGPREQAAVLGITAARVLRLGSRRVGRR
jgi:aminocarboxymuconate-semialdehyde decarboxylase